MEDLQNMELERSYGVKTKLPHKVSVRIDLGIPKDDDLYSITWVDGLNIDGDVKEVMKSIINNQESLYVEWGKQYGVGSLSSFLCAVLWRMAQSGSVQVHLSIRDIEKWCAKGKATAVAMRKDIMKAMGGRKKSPSKSYIHRKYFLAGTSDSFKLTGLKGNGSRFNVLYRKGVLAHKNALWYGDFSLDERFVLSLLQQGVNPVHFLRECGASDSTAYRKQQNARNFLNEYLLYLETGDDTTLMEWSNNGKEKASKKFNRIFRELCEYRGWSEKKGKWEHEFEESDECFLYESQRMRSEEYRRKNREFLASKKRKYKARQKQEHDMWNAILLKFNRGMPRPPRKSTKETWLYMYMINHSHRQIGEVAAIAISIRNGLYAEGVYDTCGKQIGHAAYEIYQLRENDLDSVLDVMGWDEMHHSPEHMVDLMHSLPD